MKNPQAQRIRNEMLDWLRDVTARGFPHLIVFLWAGLLAFVWIPGGLWVWLMDDYGFIGSYKHAINQAFLGCILFFDPLYYDQHIGDHPLFAGLRDKVEVRDGKNL